MKAIDDKIKAHAKFEKDCHGMVDMMIKQAGNTMVNMIIITNDKATGKPIATAFVPGKEIVDSKVEVELPVDHDPVTPESYRALSLDLAAALQRAAILQQQVDFLESVTSRFWK